jgi:hypothetical protein
MISGRLEEYYSTNELSLGAAKLFSELSRAICCLPINDWETIRDSFYFDTLVVEFVQSFDSMLP